MLSKKIAIAAIAGTALLAASGAYARHDNHRWDGPRAGYGYRHYGHQYYRYAAPRVVVRPAPVYYYGYDYAPPVYYAPPRPVIYGRIPVSPDLRIGFRLGL